MAKSVKVKTYRKKTKSGKVSVVRAHTKVDKRTKKSLPGSGGELAKRKSEKVTKPKKVK